MAHLTTLPALGLSLLVAAGTGLYLGESSIEMINPLYFQGPAIHPRDRGAAIDPNRIAPRPTAFADLYGWEEGQSALSRDCGDCEALRARDAYAYSALVPYFGDPAPPIDVRDDLAESKPEPEFREEAPSPATRASARIARYASYPVSAEEAAPEQADYKAGDVYIVDAAEEPAFDARYE